MSKRKNTVFGAMLLQGRNAMGLTLKEAADAAQCGVSTLHAMETGKATNPTIRLLGRVAELYQIDLAELAAAWVDTE